MSFKIGMVGLLNNPLATNRLVEIQRQLISKIYAPCTILTEEDDWNQYNYLIVNDPSIKRGPSDKIAARAKKLTAFTKTVVKGPLVGYDIEQLLTELHFASPTILELPIEQATNKLLLGDYHAVSVWSGPDYNLDILERMSLGEFLQNPEPADWYYFGNEDIRHYVCEETNPIKATKDLATEYIELARKCNAKVTCLLPAESEKRKLDKKYMVNDKPFCGRQNVRAELVKIFNKELYKSDLEVHTWPLWWYEKPYLYETTIMENKPSPYVR